MSDINYRIIGTQFHGAKYVPKSSAPRLTLPVRAPASEYVAGGEPMVMASLIEYRLERVHNSPGVTHYVWIPNEVDKADVMAYVLRWALRPGTASKATEAA